MKKVLITGFDPFGDQKINPSYEAVKNIPDKIKNISIVKAMLPTVFNKSAQVLSDLIAENQPDVVICVGQAGGRQGISLERVAINIDDARIPDNLMQQPIDQVINPQGKNAYFTSLPIKRMKQELERHDIEATISNSAGTFVCNHVMYHLLDEIFQKELNIKGGFVHVPYLPEQSQNQPTMTLAEITFALEKIIETAINFDDDLAIVGGSLC